MIILDDYSIECLSLVSSDFLGIHRNSFYFFGSQIYSWRESCSRKRTKFLYRRDYTDLELFRFQKIFSHRIRQRNTPGGYPSGSVSRGSAAENIPHAANTIMSSEGPINASHTRSNVSEGNLNSVGSDLMGSSAAWSTATESTQPTALKRRRSLLDHQYNNYVTNDSLELPHPVDFSSLGGPQPTVSLNADSFEFEYWERYGIEIGEEGEGGWRDLGQLASEEVIFGGSATTCPVWPHSRAYIEAGIRGEPFHSALPVPVSGDVLVKSTAPPRLGALLLAAELLESVSSDLRPVSQTNLGFLDSAVLLLDRFIQAHKEVYNGVLNGYTNTGNCPGRSLKGTSPSDWEDLFREAGNQTKQKSENHSLCGYSKAQVITGGSRISKSRVSSAEEAGTELVTSLTVAPESVTYARKKQAGRKGRFGFLDKRSSFNTTAPGRPVYSASGIASRNIGGICSDSTVSLIQSQADTKPKATAARGSVLSSSGNDGFSPAAVSLVTKMKPPSPQDTSFPKNQKIEVRGINQKGSKIPVLVKKAGGHRETDKRPLNTLTPIPWNRENSPFNSAMPASTVSLIPSLADTKPKATAARGSVLSSSGNDGFSTAAVSPVTTMKPPSPQDTSFPKNQEIEVRGRNQKGSKIHVLVKQAGGRRDTEKRPLNILAPIPCNRENSPFNSAVPASSLGRPLVERQNIGERGGSPTVRKIGSRLPYKTMR